MKKTLASLLAMLKVLLRAANRRSVFSKYAGIPAGTSLGDWCFSAEGPADASSLRLPCFKYAQYYPLRFSLGRVIGALRDEKHQSPSPHYSRGLRAKVPILLLRRPIRSARALDGRTVRLGPARGVAAFSLRSRAFVTIAS